ncbi:nuclear transport factor 2 family protein [Ectobacillus panaciterrae]|uniref:nuclear transport factor 2 family protein n=1 Tax=Ectobacillus panaciterrae TaxID=363872 RepID=UPI0003F83647|nr:nuclear transport factor 2 family protein [Ectobacillus panaciterrae]
MNKSNKNEWENAFTEKFQDAFAETFAENVVLEAVILNSPIKGRDNVQKVMKEASKIYEILTFTRGTTAGLQEYIEWEAQTFSGVQLKGVTILTRNENGALAHIAIHHRPLRSALQFSTLLGERLRGQVDPSYFYSEKGE